jgi:hypothetical protein
MATNKVIINNKEKNKKDKGSLINNTIAADQASDVNTGHECEQMPLDEKIWGNDNNILSQLNESQLSERRLFVRVRYMQQIECNTIFESISSEPINLKVPIVFTTSDLSMSGIGIICDEKIEKGTILAFNMKLEEIIHEIKYEVIYCIPNDDKFRAGLKMAEKNKDFIRHLKLFVAKITLRNNYS